MITEFLVKIFKMLYHVLFKNHLLHLQIVKLHDVYRQNQR